MRLLIKSFFWDTNGCRIKEKIHRSDFVKVIVCLDNNKGMLFNNRRQSRDSKVFEDISSYLQGELLIDKFSEKLIASSKIPYKIFEKGVTKCEANSILFIENQKIEDLLSQISQVIVYWWNRDYPSDFIFDVDLKAKGFKSVSISEFEGSSHEKITREIFER